VDARFYIKGIGRFFKFMEHVVGDTFFRNRMRDER
jgi:hypothetical protein